MKTTKVRIIDAIGIHARPATKVVNECSKWKSDIHFKLNSTMANAKSIMNLMSLAAKNNSEIEIICNGPDENEALSSLLTVLKEQKLI